MSTRSWLKLHKSLKIQYGSPLPQVQLPTDAELDQYEVQAQLKLPESYRSFIKVFGPGELIREFRFRSPGYRNLHDAIDLSLLNEWVQGQLTPRVLQRMTDPAQLRRCVFFCSKGDGDLIGWDPETVTDRKNHEYGIFRYGREKKLVHLADSFQEFVEQVCLSEANLNPVGWDEAEFGPRRTFEPAPDTSQA